MFEMLNPTPSEPAFPDRLANNENARLSVQAVKLFHSAFRSRSRVNLWAHLTHRSNALLDLDEIEHSLQMRGRHYAGVQAVLLEQIRGSEGRVRDFDSAFHPLSEKTRDRWVSVATARLQGKALPAVELIQIGKNYFVRDGHHRISVARALGEAAIDAIVTVWDVKDALPWENFSPGELAAQTA